jgi:signal transduction histidine kinase
MQPASHPSAVRYPESQSEDTANPNGPGGEDFLVQSELADLLYSSPWPVTTNIVTTLISVGLLSLTFHTPLFLSWGVSTVGICMIRVFLWRIYRQHRGDADFDPEAWMRRFTYFAAATGCQWGSLAMTVTLLSSAPSDVFVPIIIAGLAGGMASGYTAHVPVVDAFVWPVVLPLIVLTIGIGDVPHIALGILYLAFVVNLSLMARRSFHTLLQTLKAKKEKEHLVAELAEANHQAQAALRAKSEFLANMSHELRTPLNAVIGFSEIISHEVLGPIGNRKYLEYAVDLYNSGTYLLQLINDILDLTKIGTGRLNLDDDLLDVADLIESCVRMMQHRAEAQGVTLFQTVSPEIRAIRGDERRLRQIVLNLLSNSIRFTPAGGTVAVKAWLERDRLVIEVKDTGVGIAEEDLQIVFEPFGQMGNAFDRKGGGSGLGLPLTKKLVEMHQGTLEINSVRDSGTSVRLNFPPHRVVGAQRSTGSLSAA